MASLQLTTRLIAFTAAMGVWQLLAYAPLLSKAVFSPPSDALPALYSLLAQGVLFTPLRNTLLAFFVGVVLSTVISVICGIILGSYETAYSITDPYLRALNILPKVTLLPIILFLIGYTSYTASYMFGVLLAVVPVTILIRGATRNIRGFFVTVSKIMGASPLQILYYVFIPALSRNIASAIRLTSILVMTGVLAEEIYVLVPTLPTLGSLIYDYTNSFEVARLYGVIFLIAMIMIMWNEVLLLVEKRSSRNH